MTSAVDPKPMSRTAAILYAIGLPLALVALVFLPAGRIDWLPGWIFIAVLVGTLLLGASFCGRLSRGRLGRIPECGAFRFLLC
jgi:hypothetical protein